MGPDDPQASGSGTRAASYLGGFPAVPVLVVGSWFDPYATNMIELLTGLRSRTAAQVRHIMAP